MSKWENEVAISKSERNQLKLHYNESTTMALAMQLETLVIKMVQVYPPERVTHSYTPTCNDVKTFALKADEMLKILLAEYKQQGKEDNGLDGIFEITADKLVDNKRTQPVQAIIYDLNMTIERYFSKMSN